MSLSPKVFSLAALLVMAPITDGLEDLRGFDFRDMETLPHRRQVLSARYMAEVFTCQCELQVITDPTLRQIMQFVIEEYLRLALCP